MISTVTRDVCKCTPHMVRFASKRTKHRIPEKVPVQLLKDIPQLGSAGEIIKVRPAYMRNCLSMNNRAAYIVEGQGPQIPVVEKSYIEKKPLATPEEVEPTTTPSEPTKTVSTGALSLDELSNLFSTMRSKNSKKSDPVSQTLTASSDSTYSLLELKESIPHVFTIALSESTTLPITKELLISTIFNLSGTQVPTSAISIAKESDPKSLISEISEVGRFNWIISSPVETSAITKTLVVK